MKIRYNENKDLISLRRNADNVKNKEKQDRLKKVNNNLVNFIVAGILGFLFLIILFVVLMIIECDYKTNDNTKISKKQLNFLCCFFPSFIIFFMLTIFPAMKCCTIIGKLNEIGKEKDINNLKIINIIFIIFSFLLYAVIILFIVIFCIKRKKNDLYDITNVTNTSETNINTQKN